jgi:hypothetical protein
MQSYILRWLDGSNSSMTTYQLSGSDFIWKLTGANNFESVHNYVNITEKTTVRDYLLCEEINGMI